MMDVFGGNLRSVYLRVTRVSSVAALLVFGLVVSGLAAVGYTVSRGLVKTKE